MVNLALPLVWLALAAGEDGFTEPLADEKSPHEFGYQLTKEEAAAGWLALFDGKTTFGWKNAKLTDGKRPLLAGGTTTSPFPGGKLRLEVVQAGTLTIGGKRHDLIPGERVEIEFEGNEGKATPLVASPELALARIDYLPAGLNEIYDGKNFAD